MSAKTNSESAIFIRLDKIGDLISTLPCDEIAELKNFNITWMISAGLQFIPAHSVPPRHSIELNKSKSWKSFWLLLNLLKKTKPNLVISFQAPWWVSLAMWLSGTPKRVGRLSQWHSFLFFNYGLRQQRSQSLKHEAEYNAELVYHAFGMSKSSCPSLVMKADIHPQLFTRFQLEEKKYFIIHPGMAGSALNWQIQNYLQLIENLLNEGHIVAVTGTAGDEVWLKEIKEKFKSHKNFRNLQNQLNPSELLTILSEARTVFAPSTGVLHLAAALGVPTVGVYSQVLSQKSVRWRARGQQVKILEPVDQISVTQVKSALLSSSPS